MKRNGTLYAPLIAEIGRKPGKKMRPTTIKTFMKQNRGPQYHPGLSCFALLFLLCLAFYASAPAAGLSKPNNGVCLAVAGEGGDPMDAPIKSADRLTFLPFCSKPETDLAYPRSPAWGVKIHLSDPRGKTVAKTDLGKTYGVNFDRLHVRDDAWMAIMPASISYDQNRDLKGARFLAKVDELFEMEGPGIYTLEIEMKMFRIIKVGRPWKYELLHFSPLKLKVEKSEGRTVSAAARPSGGKTEKARR